MPKKKPNYKIKFLFISFALTSFVLLILCGGYAIFSGQKESKKVKKENIFARREVTTAPQDNKSISSSLRDAGQGEIKIPEAEVDSDNDGLSDALEVLYKTDPNNPDTDGDGYLDGDEVANGYDPTIPSPNDKLDKGAETGESPSPASPVPTPVPTFTQQFFNKTGLPATRSSIIENQDELSDFVNEANSRGILPEVKPEDIKTTSASGKEAVTAYLDSISIPQNKDLESADAEDITDAFVKLTETQDSAEIDAVIEKLSNNVEVLKVIEVPEEALDLHRKYLAASMALMDNTRMLKNYQQDYVGALIAAARLENLKTVLVEEITGDIQELEKKYNIT